MSTQFFFVVLILDGRHLLLCVCVQYYSMEDNIIRRGPLFVCARDFSPCGFFTQSRISNIQDQIGVLPSSCKTVPLFRKNNRTIDFIQSPLAIFPDLFLEGNGVIRSISVSSDGMPECVGHVFKFIFFSMILILHIYIDTHI